MFTDLKKLLRISGTSALWALGMAVLISTPFSISIFPPVLMYEVLTLGMMLLYAFLIPVYSLIGLWKEREYFFKQDISKKLLAYILIMTASVPAVWIVMISLSTL